MSTGIVLVNHLGVTPRGIRLSSSVNFGEPPTPDRERVLAYLERIFYANTDLKPAARERAA